MAKCCYCGKELSDNTVLEVGGKAFCNNLCRHSFEKNRSEPKVEKKQGNLINTATAIGAITAAIVAAVVGQLTTGFMQKDYSGLKEFKSPDNSFSVMLPKDVKEEKQAVNTPVGPIEFVSYNAKAKHQRFSVGYLDSPDSLVTVKDPNVLLDGARDGAIKNVQGTLLSETIIDLNGHPGRELRIEGPQKIIFKSRMYLVEKKLYVIMAVCKHGHSFDKKIEVVFNSFKFEEI